MSHQRVRIVGGPWPERIGCEGRIVTHKLDRKVYPRHGMGRGETIVLLDDDPIVCEPRPWHDCTETRRVWSCVMSKKDVAPVGEVDR